MPIPPDNRAPGDPGHITDHHDIADELTALVAADATEAARALAAEALLAPKASPALTGTPTAPTATALTGTTQVATTAYADSAVTVEANRATAAEALKAPLASPALTGSPTAPTQTAGDSSTKVATTAFVTAAAALKAGLLTPTAVKTSAYTAAAGDFVPCDTTSAGFTVTLPNAPADLTVVAAKMVVQGGTNTVTIACAGSDVFNVTAGSTTRTLTLLGQAVLLQYKASAHIWYVTADDLPLAQLDSRYTQVFSPMAYGAAGDGTADDTTAVQACAAAAVAAHGIIDLGTRTFRTTSPVTVTSNFHMRGTGPGGGITNAASNLFTITGTASNVTFENCTLTSSTGGGHIWNASSGPQMSFWRIAGCVATQNNPAKSIWNQAGGAFIDCIVEESQFTCATARTDTAFQCTTGNVTVTDPAAVSGDAGLPIGNGTFLAYGTTISAVTPGVGYTVSAPATASPSTPGNVYVGGATVPPWNVTGVAGAFNSVQFKRLRCTGGNSPAVPFFSIDNASASGINLNIDFGSVTFEICLGGAIYMTGCTHIGVDQCMSWDCYPVNTSYSFQASTAGDPCRDVTVRQSGVYHPNVNYADIAAGSACSNILIDSCGVAGTPATYSGPANQATILNTAVSGSTVPVPTTLPGPLAIPSGGGLTGATAGGRIAGWTASGPPTTGTFATGDVVPDQAGTVWTCTAGGTPGTWASPEQAPWIPSDSGWKAWNIDPASGTVQNAIPTTGTIYLMRVNIRRPISITNVILYLVTAASGGTSGQNFAGLYDSSGNRIAVTADQTTPWANNQASYHVIALSGGPYTVSPPFVWVAFVWNGGTGPTFGRLTANQGNNNNPGVAVSAARAATNGTGTSLPGSITPASNVNTFMWWAGVS